VNSGGYNSRTAPVSSMAILVTFLFLYAAGAAEPETPPAPNPVAASAPKDPWDLLSPPRPFHETCFGGAPNGSTGLTEDGAKRWLERVGSHPLELVAPDKSGSGVVTLTGLARLKAPWPADAALWLSFDDTKPLSLHFWGPREGVTLRYYRSSYWQSWVAYRITRRPAEQLALGDRQLVVSDPGLALLSTDDRGAGLTPAGTYAVRHQDGSLVMTKGDVRLLTVPMAAPPSEVYLEAGGAPLRGLAMARSGPVPAEAVRERPIVMRGDRPAVLRWQEDLPDGAALRRLPDGRVRLSAVRTTSLATASVPLIRPGLYEVVFELEDPMPGTGVYLGDDRSSPSQAVGFFRDPRNGLTYFGFDQPTAAPAATTLDISKAPAPYAGRRQWLRLVLAGSRLRCFASGDGVHWGEVFPPRQNVASFFSHVGVYCRPGERSRGVTLRRVQVRRLDALASLAPVELREQAAKRGRAWHSHEASDLGAWQQGVWETQPPGVEAGAWRRASATAALIAGARPPLANALLDGLIEDFLAGPAPLEEKLRLLEDAALVYDTCATADAVRFLAHYERLGHALVRDGDLRGFDRIRRALMKAPVWPQTHRVDPLPVGLVRDQLIAIASQQQWEQGQDLCRGLGFWYRPANPGSKWTGAQAGLRPLVNWVQARSQAAVPNGPDDEKSAIPASERHPLIVYPNKEAYTTCADLEAAVREESYAAACTILTTAAWPEGALVADPTDGQLFISPPIAVEAAMRQRPQFREAMLEHVGDVHWIRLNRAMAEGNVAAIRLATVKYHSTPVAAQAYGWLGDRLAADGQFAAAISRYRQALSMATAEQRHQLSARLRLAAAMLGREMGEPVTEPVDFHDVTLTAAKFEGLVAAMLLKYGGPSANGSEGGLATGGSFPPPPAGFAPRPWAAFQGDVGTDPQSVPTPAAPLDWPARQTAVTFTADAMLVSNRFQVAAYDLASGRIRWKYGLGEEQGPTHAWSLVPMRPQVAGARVYVRLVTKPSGTQLACLDLQTGNPLWTSRLRRHVISDPLFVEGQLFALCTDAAAGEPISLVVLAAFDPDTGVVLSESPLVELGNPWNVQHVCQAAMVDDRIVTAIAGSVLCCDTFGRVRWVRRDPWIPPPHDPGYGRQHHQAPLVRAGRVYVAQPGVRAVECLDLESGRLCWRRVIPRICQLIGLFDDKLVIETDFGIRGLDARTGQDLWHHHDTEILDVDAQGGPGGLLYVRRQPLGGKQQCPMLVWLDVATGRATGRCPLVGLAAEQPLLGPLVAHGSRLWCFAAVRDEKGALQPQRDILELVAQGPALPGDDPSPAAWTAGVDEAMRSAAAVVLPGWSVLSAEHDEQTGWRAEIAGKPGVLVTKAGKTPTRLVRRVHVPAGPKPLSEKGSDPLNRGGLTPFGIGPKPRLVLEIGHDPQSTSKLEIRADGLTLLQLTPRPTAAAGDWQPLEVDLSAHAGRDVWLSVVQEQAGDTPAIMYWKRLEVLP